MKFFLHVFISLIMIYVIDSWPERVLVEFEAWKKQFNVTFSCVFDENLAIYNWQMNKEKIANHEVLRGADATYTLGLWAQSYKDEKQLDVTLNGLRTTSNSSSDFQIDIFDVEERAAYIGGYEINPVPSNITTFNWVLEGAVVPDVGDQGFCASCYAFASAGAIEGQVFRKQSKLIKLSEQQLIDCSRDSGNRGCGTGNTEFSFRYIIKQGITTEDEYPLKPLEIESCTYNSSMQNTSLTDYRRIRIINDDFLKDLIYNVGPVAVGIYGSLFSYFYYKSGVYNDPNCFGSVNHAILLVGFGTDPVFGDYWLLKNSYGSSWGENGYFRLSRDIQNLCNITDYVVLPLL